MSVELNGKIVAEKIAQNLSNKIRQHGLKLTLGILQVGNEPSSTVYIRHKIKMAEELGIKVDHLKLPSSISQTEVIEKLKLWNNSSDITGYIVQLPLPPQINPEVIINSVNPTKDVDGLTALNKGLLSINQPGVMPATTRAILNLIDHYQINVAGKHVAILGRSNLVGLPSAIALIHRHATVTVLHSQSTNSKSLTKQADIVIAAIGKPQYLTREYLQEKAIVIDVGITSMDSKLFGDINYDQVKNHVQAITPVPGGIGPLTVISLFQNLVDIANSKMLDSSHG